MGRHARSDDFLIEDVEPDRTAGDDRSATALSIFNEPDIEASAAARTSEPIAPVRSLAEIFADHRSRVDVPTTAAIATPAAAAPAIGTLPATTPAAVTRRSASDLIASLTAELADTHPGLLDAPAGRRRHAPAPVAPPSRSSRDRRSAGPRRAATSRRRLPARTPVVLAGVIALAVVVTDQAGLLSSPHDADASAASAAGTTRPVSATSSPSPDGTATDARNNNEVSRKSRSDATTDAAAPAGDRAAPVTVAPTPVSTLKPGQTIGGTWIRPTATGIYNSCFCSRWGAMHEGIDFAAPLGSPILAVGDGTVIDAGPASGFGNWVVIQHDDGDVTVYGHMRYYYVHTGDRVTAGQEIALVGEEGQSTGPHLHLGVRQGGPQGPYVDPVPWLVARGIEVGTYNVNG